MWWEQAVQRFSDVGGDCELCEASKLVVTLLSQCPLSKTDYHSVGQDSAPFI
jgi:hypothetical protein